MKLRNHLYPVVIALVVGMVVAAGPVVAAVYDAMNAHKVDGKHAVGAGATAAERAGNLVATNSEGRLPNSIIQKAPDANRLDGKDSKAFVKRAGIFEAPYYGPWFTGDPDTLVPSATGFEITRQSGGQSNIMGMPPTIPATMFGKQVRVTAFELCYDATDIDVTLNGFTLTGAHQMSSGGSSGDYVVLDSTDYDDSTCRMFTPEATSVPGDGPILLGRNGFVQPEINLQWENDGGTFFISKATVFYELSNVNA